MLSRANMLAWRFSFRLRHRGTSDRSKCWPPHRRRLPLLALSGAPSVRVLAKGGQPLLAPFGRLLFLQRLARNFLSQLFDVFAVPLRRAFRLPPGRFSLRFCHEISVLATRVT